MESIVCPQGGIDRLFFVGSGGERLVESGSGIRADGCHPVVITQVLVLVPYQVAFTVQIGVVQGDSILDGQIAFHFPAFCRGEVTSVDDDFGGIAVKTVVPECRRIITGAELRIGCGISTADKQIRCGVFSPKARSGTVAFQIGEHADGRLPEVCRRLSVRGGEQEVFSRVLSVVQRLRAVGTYGLVL